MHTHTQPNAIFLRTANARDISPIVVTSGLARRDGPISEPDVLQSAVRLLTEADHALLANNDAARKYIVRAAALLQAEFVSREQDNRATASATRGQLAPWQVASVKRFIDAHLGEKIGLQDFAGLIRLSTNHFAKAFRATTGQAPYAYLIHRRIDRVKELMLETDLSLAHIALDCGLADQAHMTRLFTRLVGVSPGAWRRAHVAMIGQSCASKPPALLERQNGHRSEMAATAAVF